MAQVQKVMLLFALITTVVLTLTPFTKASDQEYVQSDTRNNHVKTNKLSPQTLYNITVHGFLLWASMGFLMPVGILVIRMSNTEQSGRRLKIMFYMHAILQILSVLLVTVGAVLSMRKFENAFNNNHQRLGLALYGVVWLQALIGFFRPKRGNKRRSLWFLVHWSLGTMICLLGIINVYTGLQAYHKRSSRSINVWTTIFSVEVFFIAILYLFQDKWNYIKKQGVVLGDAPVQPTNQVMNPIEEKQIGFYRGPFRKMSVYSSQ
ncbi:Cytochrome b561 domain-containing protein [Heracleum sosnowskyi]|uniref:Cytochrome b561 domain-containing protein n=1 Tax=Heracleum sosnowskyi TaxID=360622 RepID=A0AAD8N2B9_9APIA|nr:Cytochrome b561 domain-containing protein [Heracleum sosnowskyi]